MILGLVLGIWSLIHSQKFEVGDLSTPHECYFSLFLTNFLKDFASPLAPETTAKTKLSRKIR